MRGGVFISYRRDDAAGFAGRIYDRLANTLGRESAFIDVDNIPAGLDFVDVLSERVGRCDALIAVIGRNWLASADRDNCRRLDYPNDFVRIEIAAALERNVPVIPVLVDGAAMPQAHDLPDPLKKLARRQGIEISHNRFDSDAERLTEALARIDGEKPGSTRTAAAARPPAPRKRAASAARWLLPAVILAIVVGGAAFFYEQRGPREDVARQAEKTPPEEVKPTSDILKALPIPKTTSALNASAPASNAAVLAAAPSPDNASNATPDEPSIESVADSAPAKIGKADPPDTPTGPQQWMNLHDFIVDYRRQIVSSYPDKGRVATTACRNAPPIGLPAPPVNILTSVA